MRAYKIMWDSLKETAEVMVETGKTLKVEDGVNAVCWSTLLDMMEEGEEVCKVNKRCSGIDTIDTIVDALEFGFACLGVLTLVLVLMGRLAYVC